MKRINHLFSHCQTAICRLMRSMLLWTLTFLSITPSNGFQDGNNQASEKEVAAVIEYLVNSPTSHDNQSVDSLALFIERYAADDSVKANALNELSRQYLWIDFYRSLQNAEHALKISRQLNYEKGIATANNLKGFCFWAFGDNELSVKVGLEASVIAEKKRNPSLLAESFLILGRAYMDLKEIEKAALYVRRAKQISLQIKNWDLLSRVYNLEGIIHFIRNEKDSALQFYNKALIVAYQHGIARVNFPRMISNIAECYQGKNADLAFSYFNKALRLALETNNHTAECSISSIMGHVFLKTGDNVKAEKFLNDALQLARKMGLRRTIQHAYRGLVDLRLKQGKASEALTYMKNYYEVRDSLLNTSKTRQIVELEAQHELEKKEQAIKLLEQDKKMQTVMQYFLIAAVVLAILAGYFIYRLQRLRTLKTKHVLETQQLVNDKLKEVDKLKSSFFANISHEFRTPLTLILAPLESELKERSSPEERESLLLIRRSANRLLELVNQLLDLSRLESGKMDLRIKEGNLSQLLSVIAASFESLAQYKQIDFVKNINLSAGTYWFDQDKIEKIVTNLLANAFKFTPAEKSVNLSSSCEDGRTLTIIVSDTGTGIPKEEQTNVFSPFYQTRQATMAGHQGTGLGLSLVKELVKLYNGVITLESTPGAGTSFTVTLTVAKDAFNPNQIVTEVSDVLPMQLGSGTRDIDYSSSQVDDLSEASVPDKNTILIVEDNADLRDFMSVTLQKNNYAVLTAANGKEALLMAYQCVPSLVLSDLMMPVMDGIELTKQIKEDERTCHIPVIMLTARSESKSRIDGLKTGVDDYLTKPFSPEELLVRIDNLIEQRKKLAERFRERILVPPSRVDEISMDDKFLHKARGVVETNLADYTFTVEKMADEMNLSRTQLLRKLKALTGISPNDFIKDIRLKRAADLIRQKADTVTQIGYTVGFNDQSYFTKCFKKQFGVTPTEFSTLSIQNK